MKSLRGATKTNSLKTHCPRGHELTGDNLSKHFLKQGKRACRICLNAQARIKLSTPESKQYRLDWQRKNKDKVSKYNTEWNKDNRKEYSKKWDRENKQARKEIYKKHEAKPERKAYHKQYNRDNPRSTSAMTIEEQIAMKNVRAKQKNTCQWAGCGKTHKETSIHVHHILSREDHPELCATERNLICFCIDHHILYHLKKGDMDAVYILEGQRERLLELRPEFTRLNL